MSTNRPTKTRINTVLHYLQQEFPGHVRGTRWERRTGMQMFEVFHETTVHRVDMPAAFFEDCPDCADALRDSELVDYMREAKTQARRFSVMWERGMVRIRSTPL